MPPAGATRLATRFDPRRDALPAIDLQPAATDEDLLRQGLAAAADGALQALRADFSGMVDYYRLAERISDWSAGAQCAGWELAAQALQSLDAFYGHLLPPGRGSLAARRQFFRARTRQCLSAANVRLIQWQAVLYGVPEQWLPPELLRRQLHRRVEADGRFTLLDLDLMLRLPNPGGLSWLTRATRQEWQRLKGELAAGRPALVELVREWPSAHLLRREVAVAFACEEPSNDLALLHLYHPVHGAEPLTLRFDFSVSPHVVHEDPVGHAAYPLLGFFLLDYHPVRPPQSPLRRALRLSGIPQLVWWWRHRRNSSKRLN